MKGQRVVMIRLNPPVDASLAAQLIDLWTRVVNSGGTVGFVSPVTVADVEPVAQRAFSRTAARLIDLAVAFEGARPVGMGFLEPGEPPLETHIGTVRRLMRDPDLAGMGIGATVLAALEKSAQRRRMGRVIVQVRAGRAKEAWYVSQGYVMDATLPDRARVRGESVGMVHMSKSLDGQGDARADGQRMRLAVRQLDADLPIPGYAHPDDAGLDLYASRAVRLDPGERALVSTGLAVAIPMGYVGLVHPRSGLAARQGLGMVNSPGTIDAGYRGEVQVILINHDPDEPIDIGRGDRIAQLVVQRVETVEVACVGELPPSDRGERGFGSSGR